MPNDRRLTLTGALFGRMLILFAIEAVVISLLAYGGARLQGDAAYDAHMRLGSHPRRPLPVADPWRRAT